MESNQSSWQQKDGGLKKAICRDAIARKRMHETFEEPEVENSRKYEISKTLQREQNHPVMGSKLNRRQW